MAKNEFDIDFDFDKEDFLDPKENLDSDQYAGYDYQPGADGAQPEGKGQYDQYGYAADPGSDYGYDPNMTYDPDAAYDPNMTYDPDAPFDPNLDYTQDSYGNQGYGEGQYDDQSYAAEGQYDDQGYEAEGQYDDQGYEAEGQYDDQGYEAEGQYDDQGYEAEGQYDDQGYEDDGQYGEEAEEDYDGEMPESDEEPDGEEGYEGEEEKPRKHLKMPKVSLPKIRIKKPKMPNFFSKFMTLYFGPLIAQATGMNQEPEGRRRRSKSRIFKEVYLPPLILFVSLILVLSCVVGSISTAVRGKHVHDEQARKESIASAEAANREQQENQALLAQAERYAQEYDYEKAIEILETYQGTSMQEVQAKKADYVQAQSRLVEWKDPAGIPNLSFQLLIADPARAFADQELGGKYNQNFVTTDEFQRILDSLYANGYVLVDFDSFVEVTEGIDGGTESFASKPIYLPEGKKPVMITETMVNYYDYMIDPDKDGIPDAKGHGFASRLILDGAGDVKAEMVDSSGNTVVGDYDLVPILETFLKAHPDFSYQGARAVLAVTGEQGIFGYRINTSVISDPKRGQAYYEEQVAGANELVAALRAKGYTLASFTYGNRNYGQDNATQIQEDLKNWNDQIAPVLGPVNVMVFARESDIGNYTDTKFKALYDKGFRIFVGKGDEPFADITNSYVRQKRLMVTGVNMTFNPGMFNGLFDCGAVKNSTRPEVVNPK